MPTHLTRSVFLFVAVVAIAACASSSGGAPAAGMASAEASSGACALRPQDTTFSATGSVYRDCAVTSKAILLTPEIHPNFEPDKPALKSGTCAMAEVEYVVNPEGLVEPKTARLIKTNNSTFAEAVLAVLPRKRFAPAKLNGVPVRQIVSDMQRVQAVMVVMPAGQRPSSSTRPPRTSPSC